MNDFSVSMALVDYIPVIFFGVAAVILLRDLYHKMTKGTVALFSAGVIDVTISGVLKATRKLFYATDACNFEALDLSTLDVVRSRFAHLPDRDPGEHWYDTIKLPQSILKKGKKAQTADLDALTVAHFRAYLHAPADAVSDEAKKKVLSSRYVNGLLTHGGPSTDVFQQELREEKTARLFHEVLFGDTI